YSGGEYNVDDEIPFGDRGELQHELWREPEELLSRVRIEGLAGGGIVWLRRPAAPGQLPYRRARHAAHRPRRVEHGTRPPAVYPRDGPLHRMHPPEQDAEDFGRRGTARYAAHAADL